MHQLEGEYGSNQISLVPKLPDMQYIFPTADIVYVLHVTRLERKKYSCKILPSDEWSTAPGKALLFGTRMYQLRLPCVSTKRLFILHDGRLLSETKGRPIKRGGHDYSTGKITIEHQARF